MRQRQRRTPVHRHILDLSLVDHLPGGRRRRLQHRGFRRHRHRLIDRADFENDIRLLTLVGGDPYLLVHVTLESRRFGRERVGPRRQEWQHVRAIRVGDGIEFGPGLVLDGIDLGIRNGARLLIEYPATYAAPELLGKSWNGREHNRSDPYDDATLHT